MSTMEVSIKRIRDIVNHPNADRLTIVTIDGFNAIANKHDDGTWRYAKDDLVLYIPEQAVLPEWLLKELHFWNDDEGKGMLSGSASNRVKPLKLRGVFSQGILMPLMISQENGYYHITIQGPEGQILLGEGDDLRELKGEVEGINLMDTFGITKYEPPIPSSMGGQVWNAMGMTLKYDLENIQRFPDVLQIGEPVWITEKIHGTFCCYGTANRPSNLTEWTSIVTSKGLSASGLALKFSEPNLKSNLYLQTLERTTNTNNEDLIARLKAWWIHQERKLEPIYLLGEVFGSGVQDLNYGMTTPVFRLFDVYVGRPQQGYFMTPDQVIVVAEKLEIETVPVLYSGLWDPEKAKELRDGKTWFNGMNIREGIVITPAVERQDLMAGRVKFKWVSPDYLTRKNGTEYN